MTAATLDATTAPTHSTDLRHLTAQGVRDMVPVVAATAPIGVLVGVAMSGLGVSAPATVVDTLLIYGGSAQLAAADLLASHAGALTVLLTVVVVQARLLPYGASIEPLFRRQPRLFRWVGPTTLVDQTYALATARRAELDTPAAFRRYWSASSGLLTVTWLLAVGLGFIAGPILPPASPLSIAVPAIFVGLLVPRLSTRPAVVAALAAGLAAAVGVELPFGAGLLAGTAAGIAAGALAEVAGTRDTDIRGGGPAR